LFSDVREFTSISENLSPRDLAELMNDYLTPMTAVIHHAKGTIDKYMGDAIMAFWGAPLDDEAHAKNALLAAMSMLDELEIVNRKFQDKGWPAIEIGIGVHTGIMNVGNMGSEFRMAYTVLGDNVNLGSRIEGLTKVYGVDLVCSEDTVRLVPEFAYREIDRVRVKGKENPVTIFEPICLETNLTEIEKGELKLNSEALQYYREQQWKLAAASFHRLQDNSDKPIRYSIYLHRIEYFSANPPPSDWDGVFAHVTK